MLKHLLVPVDGSEPSNAAVDVAVKFASDQDAAITFVHALSVVRELAVIGAGAPFVDAGPTVSALRDAGKLILGEAAATARLKDIPTRTELSDSNPVESILESVRDEIDLIVIGSHGRQGLGRALLGSVAEAVLRSSPVPVLVVRSPGS